MSEYKEIIHNIETGETTERPYNGQELAEIKLAEDKNRAEQEVLALADATKATEKAALLTKLGITEDEARLLLS